MGKQHFLASAKVRDLSLMDIARLSDEKALEHLAQMRWGHDSKQGCPDCGSFDKHYFIRTRKQWRCKHCFHTFSVTSRTILADNKLPYGKLLLAIFFFTASVQGKSALELSRHLGVTPKTAWLLFHKFREVIIHKKDLSPLSGLIQIDGTYVGGKLRKPRKRNFKDHSAIKDKIEGNGKAKSKRTAANYRNWQRRKKYRRLVLVFREVNKHAGGGGRRTLVVLAKEEKEEYVKPIVEKYIALGSTIMTDENGAYNFLSAKFDHRTVEHSKEYATEDGTNNNQAESYNSRLKRFYYGIVHRMMPQYAFDYACEMAWREDMRSSSERNRYSYLCENLLNCPPSKWWRGYYQGKRRNDELLMYYL